MPIGLGIWRLGDGLKRISMSPIESEAKLEDTLAEDLSVLSGNLMLLGRQIATSHGKFIDLLAMDGEGNLSIIELKKHRTPREVDAQVLDYGSWVQGLPFDEIAEIFVSKNNGKKLETAFQESFGSIASGVGDR